MAQKFNFNAPRTTPNGTPMISGRDVLIRKAMRQEAERIAREKGEGAPTASAAPDKTPQGQANGQAKRAPIIPKALQDLAPKKDSASTHTIKAATAASSVPTPSQLMAESVRSFAAPLYDDPPASIEALAPKAQAPSNSAKKTRGVQHGKAPFLECSSKGDKRFSAFYAQIRARGNKSIETIYQAAKVFQDGTTGLGWKEAKGRPCVNQEEVRALYSTLWDEYIDENPHLIEVLVEASGLSDIFGQEGHACQATELWRIRERVIAERQAQKPELKNPDVIHDATSKGNPDVLLSALKQPQTRAAQAKTGIPAPKPANSGFFFSGAPQTAEDFAALGMAPPPDVAHKDAIPAHLDVPDDAFFFSDAPADDVPVFDEASRPILQQLGADRPSGLRMIAGIPATTFEGWPDAVPPGSHYEEWVWNAMDKPGHVTIELYVDARNLKKDSKLQSVLEKAYQPGGYKPVQPLFDPHFHVLISVPQPKQAPWRSATRVLLTPETLKVIPARTNQQFGKKPDFSGNQRAGQDSGIPQKQKVDPPPMWESDPAGISRWLNGSQHHNVIFGRVAIDVTQRSGADLYWMVLSRKDAERIHKEVYGIDQRNPLDREHRFGREGVEPWTSDWDPVRRQRTNDPTPIEKRHAVPPAKRYLGHWSDKFAKMALTLARQGQGPFIPDWPEEDVAALAQTHATLGNPTASKDKVNAKNAAPAPRSAPAVPLPPVKKKKEQPINYMRMRMF